jgi:enoyl-CoA hydratase/carnithine racemase
MEVICETHGHVAVLTLSRPESRNAWCPAFTEGLTAHFARIEEDDDIRCVVLTGDDRGGAFSAGADLKNEKTHTISGAAEFIGNMPRRARHAINLVADFPKPLVGAVNGYAVGIGCIISYCCDLIVASDRAEWRLPQARLGILPAHGGAARLLPWIGRGLAMRMALGFPLKAEEAYRIGLAQWLVPHADLLTRTMEVAGHIADLPPLSTRMVKESLSQAAGGASLADTALADAYRFFALELTEDKNESHAAWREKRAPVFRGR